MTVVKHTYCRYSPDAQSERWGWIMRNCARCTHGRTICDYYSCVLAGSVELPDACPMIIKENNNAYTDYLGVGFSPGC